MRRPMIAYAAASFLGSSLALATFSIKMKTMFLVVMVLIFLQFVKSTGERRRLCLLPVVFLCAYFLGSGQIRTEQNVEKVLSKKGTFMGVVTWQSGDTLWVSELTFENKRLGGSFIIYETGFTEPCIGNVISGSGTIKGFTKPTNPGEFDKVEYYYAQKVYGTITAQKLVFGRFLPSYRIRRYLFSIRIFLANLIDQLAGQRKSGIYKAIFLGDKSELSDEIRNAFQSAGIMHVLVVSGLHLSLLGMGVFKILKRIVGSQAFCIVVSIVIMGGYAYLTGSQSACLRAYFMFLLLLFAQGVGRTYDSVSATALAFILLSINAPRKILQAGFMLSFGSVLGISCVVPVIKEIVLPSETAQFMNKRKKSLYESAIFSAALPIATTPINCYYFCKMATLGPFINLIALPFVPLLFVSLLLSLVVFLFSADDRIGRLLLFPADTVTSYLMAVGDKMKQSFFSMTCTGRPSVFIIVLYYALLAVFLLKANKKQSLIRKKSINIREKRRKSIQDGIIRNRFSPLIRLVILYGIVLVLPLLFTARQKSDVEVIFLDVGQGDGILIKLKDGTTCMIDGGSSNKSKLYKNVIAASLDYYGIVGIDYWFLTHPDNDHISGFLEYMENSNQKYVKHVVVPKTTDLYSRWTKVLNENTKDYFYQMSKGQVLKLGDLSFEAVSPDEKYSDVFDENDMSLVLLMRYGNESILFCGDISERMEEKLLAETFDLSATMLKLAHHGSGSSSCLPFLKAVSPKESFVSVGKNKYGHPSQRVLNDLKTLGSNIYITKDNSAIILRLWKDHYEIQYYKESKVK